MVFVFVFVIITHPEWQLSIKGDKSHSFVKLKLQSSQPTLILRVGVFVIVFVGIKNALLHSIKLLKNEHISKRKRTYYQRIIRKITVL